MSTPISALVFGLLILLPGLAGLSAFLLTSLRSALSVLLAVAVVHTSVTALLWALPRPSLGDSLVLDSTGLLFLSVTSVLFLLAALYAVPYLSHGTHDQQASPRRFVPALLCFLGAMSLVTVSHHLGVLWAAIEATTLASAPLIYFYRRKAALEAAWKYLLICSVGIALALLGTFFLGIAAQAIRGEGPRLVLRDLVGSASHLSRPWLKAAFVLALVGYGTKMGLVPLHTWLPDAHSQAPSPVSALLSGSLLNCALLGILRFYQVCLGSGDALFARTLLVTMGFLSVALGVGFMLRQPDYKRLLAYSSVENMGVITIAMGLGGAATYGGLLHVVNDSLCKAGLFLLAGNVLRGYGTTEASRVRGVYQHLPVSGALLVVAFLAIGGSPPFGPFMSELIIFRSAALEHQVGLSVLFIGLLAVAFLAMAGVLLPMVQSAPGPDRAAPEREPLLSLVSPAVLCGAVLILGLYTPPALGRLLHGAAGALGG
jgi:hydrogenase-4 component F